MDVLLAPAGSPTRPAAAAGEVAQQIVSAAVWAPSVHNTQPWLFTADGNRIRLHADDSRRLAVADPDGREMMMSCGAALFTARLALRALGYIPEVRLLPDPGRPLLVAELSWRRRAEPTEWERRMLGQVTQRRTHRGGFDPLPLPTALLSILREGAERDGAALRVVADDGRRAVLAEVVETAERVQRLDSAYISELANWARPPGSMRRDGVPHTAYPAHPGRTIPHYPGRDFAHGHGWGAAGFTAAPLPWAAGVVCVLTTPGDHPAEWIRAGQALQRILLTNATCGVTAALHSQPLELPWLRDFIRSYLSDGAYPQLVLRLGRVTQTALSVRRPASDVLFTGIAGQRRDRP